MFQSGPASGQLDDENDESASPVAGLDSQTNACVSRWKNMANESKKKMWNSFRETGVFVTTCRHGIILLWNDMIESGER